MTIVENTGNLRVPAEAVREASPKDKIHKVSTNTCHIANVPGETEALVDPISFKVS